MLKTALIGAMALGLSAHHTVEPRAIRVSPEKMQAMVEHLDRFDNRDGQFELVSGTETKPSKTATHRFSTWDKTNPWFWVGNADTPEPPDWYEPGSKFRKLRWHLRNPGHNFMFYVVGFADKVDSPDFERAEGAETFSKEPGWTFAASKYKGVPLPYVSYQKYDPGTGTWTKGYIGYRPKVGALGAKFNWRTKEKP